jgi:hypothetical protein
VNEGKEAFLKHDSDVLRGFFILRDVLRQLKIWILKKEN